MLKPMLPCVTKGFSNGPIKLILFWVFLVTNGNTLSMSGPPRAQAQTDRLECPKICQSVQIFLLIKLIGTNKYVGGVDFLCVTGTTETNWFNKHENLNTLNWRFFKREKVIQLSLFEPQFKKNMVSISHIFWCPNEQQCHDIVVNNSRKIWCPFHIFFEVLIVFCISQDTLRQTARLTTLYYAPSWSELITKMQNRLVQHLVSTKLHCAPVY